MKIRITHNQCSIDPAATIPAGEYRSFIRSLESRYDRAILREYPHAEVDFRTDADSGTGVSADNDPYGEIAEDVERIIAREYEAVMAAQAKQKKA